MNILRFSVDKSKEKINYVNIEQIKSFYYDGEFTYLSAGDAIYCLPGDRTIELRKALCQINNGIMIQLD